jgi:hypothetical protein
MGQCNLETLIIDKSDFDCIGQVANHCDWDKLCIYIREQQNLYLLPKIGFCLLDKIVNNLTDPIIEKLLCGGSFTDSSGQVSYFFGLKRVLAHASYAAYFFRHGFTDTPFGVVQKLNQDSLPVPINELRSVKNEHYNNAETYFVQFEAFLATIKDEALIKDCYAGICGTSTQTEETQRRQYSFSNISKND